MAIQYYGIVIKAVHAAYNTQVSGFIFLTQ